ncbi:type II secretion system protein [Pelagicoccus mobilis]|uniref:Type II secretion system protein n=1 Tax=Pelagicoccus mobilis TaxID=415221 RepID=A0A934RZ24_9BACT|nr:type II secretion system protein [Pelagicoccus mobilis]MBK1879236.1 type II secretion system protein [Pelagicoccus mobilis]
MNKATQSKQGFTLIEILVAIVVIGVLASIGIPFFQKYIHQAKATTFANDIRILANAGDQYALESGWWVDDTSSGVFPDELEGYVSRRKFELGSSLGGVWDFEQDDVGDFTSAVGVVSPIEKEELFVMVDKRIDDGDLSTGVFQKVSSDRYYYVIAE